MAESDTSARREASLRAWSSARRQTPDQAGVFLAEVDPDALDQPARCALALAWERHARWVESRRLRALQAAAPVDPVQAEADLPIVRAAGPDTVEAVRAMAARSAQAELAAVLALPTRAVAAQLRLARTLVDLLPSTLALLSFGQASVAQVKLVAKACAGLTPEQACEVEQRVLPRMVLLRGEQSLRRQLSAALAAVVPGGAEAARRRDREEAAARRGLWLEPQASGLVDLVLSGLDPLVAAGLVESLRAEAAGGRGDGRSLQQRVADLALQRLLGGGGALPSVEIQVVVRLESLLGGSSEPAMVAEGGPLPADMLPDLVARSSLRRLLIDDRGRLAQVGPRLPPPSVRPRDPDPPGAGPGTGPPPPEDRAGQQEPRAGPTAQLVAARLAALRAWRDEEPPTPPVAERAIDPRVARMVTEPADPDYRARLDRQADRRRPGAELSRHIRIRDRRCRFPGCSAPSSGCDDDHQLAWADGGRTTMANCHSLCGYHHRIRHLPGWSVHTRPDGTTVWTAPHGGVFEVPATDQRLLDA